MGGVGGEDLLLDLVGRPAASEVEATEDFGVSGAAVLVFLLRLQMDLASLLASGAGAASQPLLIGNFPATADGTREMTVAGAHDGEALAPEEVLAARPYDLRHAAVSLWLNAGVPPTTIANRAGHSVDVLLRVYANCSDGGEEIADQRTTSALAA
jgi:hypothetical protein